MPKICRFCLKTDENAYSSLETEEYKTQIGNLFPEMNLNIVEKPVICSNCNDILSSAHTFKLNCLQIEEQLKKYLKNGETKINLEDVLKNNEKPEELLTDVKFEVTEAETSHNVLPIEEIYIEETVVREPTVKKHAEKTIPCRICKKSIVEQSLREHLRTHVKSNFICVICAKGFDNAKDYITHKQKMHQANLTCTVCNKLFFNYGNLQKHMKNHEQFGDFRCKVCGLNTNSKQRLEEHSRVHTGERPFKCKYCDKSFAQNSTLSTHTKATHLNDRPYMCDICGKSFAVRGSYGTHLKSHQEVVKNFVCKECGKAYRVASELKDHERRHAGIKDRICEMCGKGFVDNHSLKLHLRIHTGDKPYGCPICEKKFNTNFNRKVHLKTCMQRNAS